MAIGYTLKYNKTYLFEIKKLSLMHEIIFTLHHQLKIKHKLYNILIHISKYLI